MPRNVRNWWIETSVDGRDSEVSCGPVSKDGGFTTTIYMREKGEVTSAMRIEGFAAPDGTLRLTAWNRFDGTTIHIETER